MNPEELPEEIFDLLSQKQFEELNEEEEKQVLLWMDPEEYDELASVVRLFEQTDKNTSYALEERHWPNQQFVRLKRLAQFPIPAYQVAALALLLFWDQSCFGKKVRIAGEELPAKEITTSEGTPISKEIYPAALVFNP